MTLQFKKTQLPFSHSKGLKAFDCHYHSRYSDGYAKIDTILQKAKEYNIGIAITDHNDIRGAIKAYNNTIGVPVIPGIEVNCKGTMHLLLYFYHLNDLKEFYNTYVKPYKRVDPNIALKKMTALKIVKIARQYKCLVVLAHPYYREAIEKHMKREEHKVFFSYIDCIEVINGTQSKKTNQKAFFLAKKLNKTITGGSDGHIIKFLGSVLMISKSKTVTDFLDSMKKGDISIIGTRPNTYQMFKAVSVVSMKHVNAVTKKHQASIVTSLGLYMILQKLLIPILFLAGSMVYKKIRSKKNDILNDYTT